MLNPITRVRESYKGTKFYQRLIGLAVVAAVAAALSFNFEWNLVLVEAILVGGFFALEILIFKPFLLSAGFLTALYGLLYIVFIGYYSQALSALMNVNQLAFVNFMFYAGGALNVAILLVGGWFFANGRYWFTLFVGYFIHLTSLVLLLLTPVNPIYIPLIGIVPVILWLVVRRFWLHKKSSTYDISSIPSTKNDTKFVSKMHKLFPNSHFMQEDRVTVIYNTHHVMLMLPVTAEQSLDINHKGLFLDGEDITFVMEHLTNKLNVISKSAKVNGKKLFPIVYVTNDKMERAITPVTFRTKQKPDVPAGTVFLMNQKDFTRFMREVKNSPEMTSKERTRYEKEFNIAGLNSESPEAD